MNTAILLIIGGIAIAIFLVQYLVQISRIRHGHGYVGGGRAFINWLLLILVGVSFGAYAYDSNVLHTHQLARLTASERSTKSTKVKKSSVKPKKTHNKSKNSNYQSAKLFVNWDDKEARLNSNGVASVALRVSPNTHVEIIGQQTGTVYKEFTTKNDQGKHTVYYDFQYAGKYQIRATRKGKHLTKELIINPAEGATNSNNNQVTQRPAVNNQQPVQPQTTRVPNTVQNIRQPQRQSVNPYYRRPVYNQQTTTSASYSQR